MYNETHKQIWLNMLSDNPSEHKGCVRLMEKIALHEAEMGKDFAEMSPEERKVALSDLQYKTPGRARQDISRLNKYLQWNCYLQGRMTQKKDKVPITWIKIDGEPSVDFTEEKDLFRVYADKPYDDGSLIAIFCALAWAGYPPKDIYALQEDEVVLDGERLFIRGREVDEGPARDLIIRYKTNKCFGQYYKQSGDKFVRRLFVEGSSKRETKMTQNYIYRMVNEYNNTTTSGINIVLLDILRTGVCYRAMQYEKEYGEIDYAWMRANTPWKDARTVLDLKATLKSYREDQTKEL